MAEIKRPVPAPKSVEIHDAPREPVSDPTLGISVNIDRDGTPKNRLVTFGDSLSHGFMSGAVFRTELSWPAIIAYELGLRSGLTPQSEFRFPTYERPDGPGGLPIDLERFARHFEAKFGPALDWHEVVSALRWLRRYMDGIEDYWERGDGQKLVATSAPYHNLAVYGWDVLDVQLLNAAQMEAKLRKPSRDNVFGQLVENDSAIAARVVLDSCRAADGMAGTVLDAARAMGEEGTSAGAGPGIETLVVMLGANNALGSVVELVPRWTPDAYLDASPEARLRTKGPYNVWQPPHFAEEWKALVTELKTIKARHVILATVPQVTIAPIARGVKGKARLGSRYYRYYTKPWITDDQFDTAGDPWLFEDEARSVDSAIDAYNATIIESVTEARRQGLDWYVFDLCGALDRMASRRYKEDPSARPTWWREFPLPPELTNLPIPPDTRFYRTGSDGQRSEGGIFSLDGIHPTTSTYGLVANEIIKIMDNYPRVPFRTATGTPRTQGTVAVDFARLLAADTLLSRPPAAITSTLSLLGWLDDRVDWVRRLLPFV